MEVLKRKSLMRLGNLEGRVERGGRGWKEGEKGGGGWLEGEECFKGSFLWMHLIAKGVL